MVVRDVTREVRAGAGSRRDRSARPGLVKKSAFGVSIRVASTRCPAGDTTNSEPCTTSSSGIIGAMSAKPHDLRSELEHIIRADIRLGQLLNAGRELNLPQWRLVAGCIYQTVWNKLTGRPPCTGINDYELIYFDDRDLSKEAEAATEQIVRERLSDLPAPVDVRNQARVHLWFQDYFGIPYAPLSCADEAITRYASITHAVGVRLTADGRLDVYAPFGLEDIFAMIIRPNYALPNK